MDKKSIIGIVIVVVLFGGFAYINSKQADKYQKEMTAYKEYVESQQPIVEDTVLLNSNVVDALAVAGSNVADSLKANADVAQLGASLAAAKAGATDEIVSIENEVIKIDFATRGGLVKGVTLKDYTKFAPKGKRDKLIQLFDPATAKFDMSFYVKNGNNDIKINTMDYTFVAQPITTNADGAQVVTMRLPVADSAYVEYEYLIYNTQTPSRDYLVDFNVKMVNMATQMSNQSSLGIAWSNTSYQNERGFQNENMFTNISYRLPNETSIDDMSMSTETKTDRVETPVNWIAFKQQYFASVFIAKDNFSYADMAFSTAAPESEYLKDFSTQLAVPYNVQMEDYNFAFYFGPNEYAILKKVTDTEGSELYLERLVPLGWGIFGWINRWFVIPVFDFLRLYISSFGLIILILAVLVKLIISPLTYKSYVSMAKMRIIKPEVDELAKKFPKKEDAMKKQQATMELYKKAGVNPMGGCIPMLIQMPIIFAMFKFFPASIQLREQPFLWADDLSSYDSIANLPFNIPFYGDHVSLFALLMAIALFGFSYINYQQTASSQPQMAGMKFMMVYLMPFMMLFWFNSYSSGLCYYYFLANLLTIGQTLVIRRMIDDSKIHAIMKASASKGQNRKKSKFQLRYEEMMQQQEKKK